MGLCRFSVWLFLLVMAGCQTAPSPHTAATASNTTPRNERATVSRDLSRDEAAGGHVLRKHVGRTDSELQERLQRERHIAAASTYTDRNVAEHAVGAAIQQQQARIESWLARAGGHPNLVLDYEADQPIGRTMHRGQDRSEPCSHAVVVLRWTEPADYYVLTSYPECR
jgi:Bacterial CdiA-CT RNAse A domain